MTEMIMYVAVFVFVISGLIYIKNKIWGQGKD